jgi:hypothetical protein
MQFECRYDVIDATRHVQKTSAGKAICATDTSSAPGLSELGSASGNRLYEDASQCMTLSRACWRFAR